MPSSKITTRIKFSKEYKEICKAMKLQSQLLKNQVTLTGIIAEALKLEPYARLDNSYITSAIESLNNCQVKSFEEHKKEKELLIKMRFTYSIERVKTDNQGTKPVQIEAGDILAAEKSALKQMND